MNRINPIQSNYHKLVVFTDGGARGNPGPAGIGWVIKNGNELMMEQGEYVGETTNNIAEYKALISVLTYLVEHEIRVEEINCRLDSQLVVEQLNGRYKVKHPNLKPLYIEVNNMIKQLKLRDVKKIAFTHIPREENKEADKLVNQALDEHIGK